MTAPIVWSIAGTDSAGGAGLAADQRAAGAFGVHLCPVVAAVTAQNSRAVTRIEPLPLDLLDAQLQALSDDMPPRAVKTGLLGGAAQVEFVARWIDRLRATHGDVALVVDPVLAASSGASFANAATLAAYRDALLPRATLTTPNRREAVALAGRDAEPALAGRDAEPALAGRDAEPALAGRDAEPALASRDDALPALATALRAGGASAACITGGDDAGTLALDWLAAEHAQGWVALPRIATPHTHGTGCTFASSAAAALALGFVAADAVVLAKMATAHALRHGHAAGAGAGPVAAREGFASDPSLMPVLSFDAGTPALPARAARDGERLELYAIVDSAERVRRVLAAGVRTVQLRIKTSAPNAADARSLRAEVAAAVTACRDAGARLFVNDHWQLAIELRAHGVHLGQEDLLALGPDGRRLLAASGLALGVSSHSLWELARAVGLAPAYIACGPVWPTSTKAMPWRPQGLDNLAWWCAVAAPTPVVAIGGILAPEQVRDAAACGPDGVCIVRVLGDDPSVSVPALRAALDEGRWAPRRRAPALPQPSLPRSLPDGVAARG